MFSICGGGGGTLLDSKNRLEIHCFEPSAFTFAKLSQTHANNPVIRLNNCALSNREEEAILYSDGDGSGLASLTKRRLDHFAIDFNKQENITLTTLDTYAMTHNIEHIHLLKLDVEGHELDVLHGGLELFDQEKIDMVTFEFGGCNIDTRTFFQDFWYFFTEKNFLIFRILPRGKLLPITSYKETYEQFITTNYLAIRKEVRDSSVF